MIMLLTNLDTRFGQSNFHCHLFAHEDIRILGLAKEPLENVQLGACERGPLATLLSWRA